MPTTVVQDAGRTFEDEGYEARLRRPVHLEGLGQIVRGQLPRRSAQALVWGRQAPRPQPSKQALVWGRMMPMHGLSAASPCPAGYKFRHTGNRCFCDAELQGLRGLGEEIPCPPEPTVVAARQGPAYTVYRAPKAETAKEPEDQPELVVTNDEEGAVEPDLPAEGQTIPVRKLTPPWVYWAAGGTGAAVVVGWLLFRRKKGR